LQEKEENCFSNKIGFNTIILEFENMHDAMIMHKRKITNKSNMGIFLGRYTNHVSCPHAHHQNGFAERKHRYIV
jgi:hypothetical protein